MYKRQIYDRLGDGHAARSAYLAMRRATGDLALHYMATGQFKTTDALSAAEKAEELVVKAFGERAKFQGRKTILAPQNPLSEPKMDSLASTLRNKKFLRDKVYPHLVPNPFAVNIANRNKSVPIEVLDRSFTDPSEVKWMQTFEGIYPTVENPMVPDARSSIVAKDLRTFMIPYGDLPTYIVREEYQ